VHVQHYLILSSGNFCEEVLPLGARGRELVHEPGPQIS